VVSLLQAFAMPLSEEELKSALISSGAVFHNSHDAIIVIDSSSKIVFCNGAALDCFGYDDQSALIGEPVENLMNTENAAHHNTYVARHLSGHDVPIMNQLRRIKAKKSNGQLFRSMFMFFTFRLPARDITSLLSATCPKWSQKKKNSINSRSSTR
jgi:PAS domain S-box-containing protein